MNILDTPRVETYPHVEEDFSSSLMGMLDLMAFTPGSEGQPVFHCSMDDFGTCEKDGVRGIAAYVAPKACWDKFNRRWDDSLREWGLQYLHTAKFLNKAPLIGDQPKTEEDNYNLLKPFLQVVREEIINAGGFGIVVLTECSAYDSLSDTQKRFVREPFRNSFEMLIGFVCKSIGSRLGRDNPLAFEVDESDVPADALVLLKTFIDLKKQNERYRESLGAICFADDKMLRSIQAADMLGNLALKDWRKHKAKQPLSRSFNAAMMANGANEAFVRVYDRATLERIADKRRKDGYKMPRLSDLDMTAE